MTGRKIESSMPTKDGGILTGENGVGAMHHLDSSANTQAPDENLPLVVSHKAIARAREDGMNAEGGKREFGEKHGNRQIVGVDGVVEEGQNERPRLEEGFYELEAIRKKRIRQGKVQYLIKWRGWPESSNTWEPHENLSSCPAVIAAFERRSRARSGKRSTRGRKRKFTTSTLTGTEIELDHSAAAAKVTPQTKTRRKQHSSAPAAMDVIHTAAEDTMRIETRNMRRRSSAAANDNVLAAKEVLLVEPVPFPCLDDSNIENHVNNVCSPKNSGSSAGLNGDLSSLDKSVAVSEETQIPGDCIPTHPPGFPKLNIAQPVRSGPRAPDCIPTHPPGFPKLNIQPVRSGPHAPDCIPPPPGFPKSNIAQPVRSGPCGPDCIPPHPGFPKSNIAQPVRSGPRAPAAIVHTAAEDTMLIETRKMRCCSNAAAKDNVTVKKEIVLVEPVPFPCLDDSNIENHVNNDVCSLKNSVSSAGLNGHNLITNGSSLDKAVADSEETQIPGDCIPTPPPGFSKSNIAQSVRYGPCVRKTVGSATQFKKDSSADASDDAPDPIRRTTCGSETAFGKDNFEDVSITEIVRPMNVRTSVNRGVPHVSITFVAKRSDGKVVTVSNDYLKVHNPQLLVNFYEANMRCFQVPSV